MKFSWNRDGRYKGLCCLLAAILMLNTLMFVNVFAAGSSDKGNRSVYVHANVAESAEINNVSEVYIGDEADIFLDIDKPNKAETADEEHYNLAGYTVKFYYDGEYFSPIDNAKNPLDYKYPFTSVATGDKGNVGDDGVVDDDNLPDVVPGLYVHAYGTSTEEIGGKTYQTAYATILISGKDEKFPDKDVDWYSLCRLQLKPLKTGSTEVFIELDTSAEQNYGLELLAKNNNSPDFRPTFDTNIVNGGYHQIIIKNKTMPNAPIPDVQPGSYSVKQSVSLRADKDSEVYYTLDSSVPATPDESKYTLFNPEKPIQIDRTSTIQCYAKRTADGKTSRVVSYRYIIIPPAPTLYFIQGGTAADKVPNYYVTDQTISVWATDSDQGDKNIADENEIYYTFSNLTAEQCTAENIGSDPQTQWVKVIKTLRKIDVGQTSTLKLLTVRGEEKSDVSTYYFGFRPKTPTANPSGGNDNNIYQVVLNTETTGAEIYYTVDGSDPRSNGRMYADIPINITENTVLRAVAKFGDDYSDVAAFYYTIVRKDSPVVSAFEAPGVYESGTKVTLYSSNYDDTIYYTVDGSEPTETSPVFTPGTVLEITEDMVIKAFAKSGSGLVGQVMSFNYYIKPEKPSIVPGTTQFANSGVVTIFAPQLSEAYEMYYTLDGSDPTVSSTRIKAESASVILNISSYTKVSAVTVKNGKIYSDVAAETYDIAYAKPIKPIPTLNVGTYVYDSERTESFTTQFLPVPNGTKIYYSIGQKGGENYPPADPMLGLDTTKEYAAGEKIEIRGETIIKAVAVNAQGQKSDIGVFYYNVVPETPVAPPSAVLSDPIAYLPVFAPSGSTVTYTVNGVQNTVLMDDFHQIYIDPNTGLAYKDQGLTEKVGTLQEGTNITAPFKLNITSELDGNISPEGVYEYSIQGSGILAAPYADRLSGTYDEAVIDGDGNLLDIHLNTLTPGAQIEYSIGNDGIWKAYQDVVKINGDTVLNVRTIKEGKSSEVKTYFYHFAILPPVISLKSGVYNGEQTATISLDPRTPQTGNYNIFYRRNGDGVDVRYSGQPILIDKTMSLRAYVVKDYGTASAEMSKGVFEYYIIESGNFEDGRVYAASPFDQRTRYSVHEIAKAPYANGIKLISTNQNMAIMYYYSYTLRDSGQTITSEIAEYQNSPIMVTPSMKDLHITAWLVGQDGTSTEQEVFAYHFYDIGMPQTDLSDVNDKNETIEYKKGTEITFINGYPDDENTFIYYTTDGSDPTDEKNAARKLFDGEKITLDKNKKVRAAYFSRCGACVSCKATPQSDCLNAFYGPVAEWNYAVKSNPVVIGSGGNYGPRPTAKPIPTADTGGVTTDYFGNEHPTHIGYINGYPDGSVQPEGDITREEMATVLYRVIKQSYDAPKVVTGTVFTDIDAGRWSAQAVEYLAEQKILEGYPEGAFAPENAMTRAEFSAMVSRWLKAEEPEEIKEFPDVNSSSWAYQYIYALADLGFVQGYEDQTFRPDKTISRAEVMTVMNKILGRAPSEEYVKAQNFNPYSDLQKNSWYYTDVIEATITHNYILDDGIEIKWMLDEEK